jgi:hypothetical protein
MTIDIVIIGHIGRKGSFCDILRASSAASSAQKENTSTLLFDLFPPGFEKSVAFLLVILFCC